MCLTIYISYLSEVNLTQKLDLLIFVDVVTYSAENNIREAMIQIPFDLIDFFLSTLGVTYVNFLKKTRLHDFPNPPNNHFQLKFPIFLIDLFPDSWLF